MKFAAPASLMSLALLTSAAVAAPAPAPDAKLERRQGLPYTTVKYCTDRSFLGTCNTQQFSTLCANMDPNPVFKNSITAIKNLNPDPKVVGPEYRECTWYTGPDCTGDALGYDIGYQDIADLGMVQNGKFNNRIASFKCYRNHHT